MNAVEKLQAAIDRLETLRDTGDGRHVWDFGPDDNGVASIVGDPGDMNLGLFSAHENAVAPASGRVDREYAVNAELVVTLHRTIDAQLAILRFAVKRLEAVAVLTGKHAEAHEHELALADAILGEGQG